MRILTPMIILLATGAAATAASAQPKASDAQYLQASRCAGLAASANLGGSDTATLDGWLKANSEGRSTFVTDRATQMRSQAKIQGNRASGLEKQQLTSELGGACANIKS
jgi:hypothetical protein